MVFEGYSFSFDWEVALMEWLQAHIPEGVISFVSQFSAFGEEMILIAIMSFIYLVYNKEMGRKIGTTICLGLCAAPMIKNLFFRRRPYFDNEGIKCLRPVDSDADLYDIAAQGYSFPSGHSTNAALTYSSIARYAKNHKKIFTIIAVVLSFLVGFSRVVVGCHFPTDVLCGWVLGLAVMMFVSTLYGRISDRRVIFVILAVLGGIGMFYCDTNDYFASYGLLLGFMLSEPFEKKYVNFKETRSPLSAILRIALAGLLYFGLNILLKLPFSKDFLSNGTLLSHLIRTLRYGVIIFLIAAVYPMLFRFAPFRGRNEEEQNNDNL